MSAIAASDRDVPAAASRRLDLDWVRIGAFGVLILYHVGMFYVPAFWLVKSPRLLPWLSIPMLATNPWRLPLLFLVSGAATRFMADKMTAGRLAGTRTVRLLLPLLFGVLIVVPPQSYLQVVQLLGYSGGFKAFYALYLHGYRGFCDSGGCLTLPTYNHMWFVAYLLVYTLLLAPLLAFAQPAMAWLQRTGEGAFSGWGLLLWPMLAAIAARLLLATRFPQTYLMVGDWYLHASSAAPFLFGFLFAKSDGVWSWFVRLRWASLGLAVTGYALLVGLGAADDQHVQPAGLKPVIDGLFGIDQWGFIAAVLGFARRHLTTRDGPVRRYLTEAIFPFYIVHQTAIIVAAYYLAALGLPLGVEASVLIVITVAACFLTFELVRRVAWLRPLFGLRLSPRQAPVGAWFKA